MTRLLSLLRLAELSLRQQLLLLFVAGAAGALSMPPIGFWPILLLIFRLLWTLLHQALTGKQIFALAWVFCFGYYTAGLYWIAAALFVDIAHNWWVLPFSVFGLPALMAFYPALATWFWYCAAFMGVARVLLFVVLWALAEWVRGWCFTGFPWNLWGYAWMDHLSVMQGLAVWGIYGQTLLVLLVAMLPVLWRLPQQRKLVGVLISLLLCGAVALIAWGQGRIHTRFPTQQNNFTVRVVQPNIPQEAKWDAGLKQQHEDKLWRLSATPTQKQLGMIIWPETALTLVETNDLRQLQERLQTQLPQHTILATGVLDVGWNAATHAPIFSNRLAFYQATGARLGFYDKSHLVPFGEYLPYQEYWPVQPVAFQAGRFAAGHGATTIALDGVPSLSPLICYEVLFPGAIVPRAPRPAWLLNVTNDGWYGRTSGPYQHLAIARARAIEEGLPLVRAANTGVSSVIDPFGRIVDLLPLGTQGVMDVALPPALQPTFYARYGQWVFVAMLGITLLLALLIQNVQRKKILYV